jgi:cardiolipin synthase
VLLRGPCLEELNRAFHLAWQNSRLGSLRRLLRFGLKDRHYDPRTSWVRLNQSLMNRRFLNRDLARRLKTAKNRVLIVSGYFLPTRGLMSALKSASRNGVRVEIVVPGPSDVPVVKWAAAGLYLSLLKAGVRLHEYRKSVLHAKFWAIDDWASLGSMNLNHRSVFHDLEVEATFREREDVEGLVRQWEIDRNHCAPITIESLKSVGWPKRILQFIAFRLRYIL